MGLLRIKNKHNINKKKLEECKFKFIYSDVSLLQQNWKEKENKCKINLKNEVCSAWPKKDGREREPGTNVVIWESATNCNLLHQILEITNFLFNSFYLFYMLISVRQHSFPIVRFLIQALNFVGLFAFPY